MTDDDDQGEAEDETTTPVIDDDAGEAQDDATTTANTETPATTITTTTKAARFFCDPEDPEKSSEADCECPTSLGCAGGSCKQKGTDRNNLVCDVWYVAMLHDHNPLPLSSAP